MATAEVPPGVILVAVGYVVLMLGGVTVLVGYFARRGRGADPLGPGPEGSTPDTLLALVVSVPLWFVVNYAVGATLAKAGIGADKVTAAAAQQLVNLAFALPLLRIATRNGWRPVVSRARLVAAGVLGGVVVFGVAGLVGKAVEELAGLFGHRIQPQMVVEEAKHAQQGDLAVLALVAVVVAPFAEEVFFRGLLLPAAMRLQGRTAALITQAAIFGLIHVVTAIDTWPLAIPLALVGWCLGVLYLRTGSLLVPVLAHATFNGINFALLRATT